MNRLSLLDKIKILIEVSKSSYWFFIVLFLLVGMGFILFKTNKQTAKKNKKIYILFSALIFIIVLITFQSSLNHLLDYLMNNIFISIFFPNFAIYFLGIIITNIILWISLFHFKTSEMIKKVNIIVYLVLNYLLVLTLSITDTKKIDIFSENSIYQSEKATALIQLSSLIFVIWIMFLILYKIILIYVRKDYKQKVKKVVVTKTVKKLPENYVPTVTPNYLVGTPGKRITLIETNPNRMIEEYERKLTIADYQLLLKILKEEKEKKNSNKNVFIEDSIKKMKQEEKMRETEKYTELEMLYRGIR